MCLTGRALAVVLLLGAAVRSSAQEPSGPPPPSSGRERSGPDVRELLPDIGRIGAEVGLLGGVSWNPYQTGQGGLVAGFIDLPLARAAGGKLSYEIFLGATLATSDPFTISVGSPQLPLVRLVTTRLRAVDVSPFSLKYAFTRRGRLRPYVTAGADILIAATRLDPAATAPELEARGTPQGEASIALGGHAGGGFELRLSSAVSWNAEYRFARFDGRKNQLHGVTTGLGIHW